MVGYIRGGGHTGQTSLVVEYIGPKCEEVSVSSTLTLFCIATHEIPRRRARPHPELQA
jgi:hypothetical protein